MILSQTQITPPVSSLAPREIVSSPLVGEAVAVSER